MKLITIISALVICIFGFVFFNFMNNGKNEALINKGHPIYDTILHEDGTKEHRLINSGRDGIRGTGDDQHWVLRIPKYIYSRSKEDSIRLQRQEEPHSEFIYNRDLHIRFRYPNPETFMDFETDKDNLVSVFMDSEIRIYGNIAVPHSIHEFAWNLEVYSNRRCRPEKELSLGLVLLRDPTQIEVDQMYAEFGTGVDSQVRNWDDGCGSPFQEKTHYLVKDESGLPIGRGHCSKESLLEDPKASCVFRLWNKLGRIINVHFSKNLLPQSRVFFKDISNILDDAIIFKKSKNISYSENTE